MPSRLNRWPIVALSCAHDMLGIMLLRNCKSFSEVGNVVSFPLPKQWLLGIVVLVFSLIYVGLQKCFVGDENWGLGSRDT